MICQSGFTMGTPPPLGNTEALTETAQRVNQVSKSIEERETKTYELQDIQEQQYREDQMRERKEWEESKTQYRYDK